MSHGVSGETVSCGNNTGSKGDMCWDLLASWTPRIQAPDLCLPLQGERFAPFPIRKPLFRPLVGGGGKHLCQGLSPGSLSLRRVLRLPSRRGPHLLLISFFLLKKWW